MKVVLIGDSIRMGYQPLVAEKCGEAEVWGPAVNGRHSLWALDHFEEWVAAQEPDIVHVNFGIHDCSIQPDGEQRSGLWPNWTDTMRQRWRSWGKRDSPSMTCMVLFFATTSSGVFVRTVAI